MKKKSDIILIGNGPSVKSHKMGELIDSYDTVVRFNWYHTKGYEEYVGTKTDIWFTTIFDPMRAKKEYRLVYEHSWQWKHAGDKTFNLLWKACKEKHPDQPVIKTCHKICMDMLNWFRDKHGQHRTQVWNEKYECWSTGAIAAWWFLMEKNGRYDADGLTPYYDSIDLYGFDWWAMSENDKHHYGDAQTVGKNHQPQAELKFFDFLHREGRIYDINPDSEFNFVYE